jgi:hypothetical protein
MRRPMRRLYIVLIALGVILFFAIAALLARAYAAEGAERSAVTALVKAEARGEKSAVLKQIRGCRASPSCSARVAGVVARLAQPGGVLILAMHPSTGFSLGSTEGVARVAWKSPSSLPIVQCVRVRRAGDAISGFNIELLALSPRIPSDSGCPRGF